VDYDQDRDAWLRSQGYTVLRFWNNDVMQQLEGVLEQIRGALGSRSRRCPTSCIHTVVSPDPSPTSGRGE